jgi:hypothetical protein
VLITEQVDKIQSGKYSEIQGRKKDLKGWGQDQPSLVQTGERSADEVIFKQKYNQGTA